MSNKTHAQILREWMDKINEAPLVDFDIEPGAEKSNRYGPTNRRLLKNHTAREKAVTKRFAKCPFNFRIYIDTTSEAFTAPTKSDDSNSITLHIGGGPEYDEYEDNGHPLTPWMMTHYLAHTSIDNGFIKPEPQAVIQEKLSKDLVRLLSGDYVERVVDDIENGLLNTFLTCSPGNADNECINQLLSQYIITGGITFNPFSNVLRQYQHKGVTIAPGMEHEAEHWHIGFAKFCEKVMHDALTKMVGWEFYYR